MNIQPDYYTELAATFVRGKLAPEEIDSTHRHLFTNALSDLTVEELQELIQLGKEHGLRLHRFKRTMELPRVRKVLGILKGLQPVSLLDIGSGRGAFLWPLLHEFSWLPVTTLDILDYRVADIQAVHRGGIEQLTAVHGDITQAPFIDKSFDVVTMLEVLEHIPDTARALAEICRIARRYVIFSVPSKPDDNPEHIHLFSQEQLNVLLQEQSVTRVTYEYVLNHMVVLAKIDNR